MNYNFMYNKKNGDMACIEQYRYIDREEYEVIRFNSTSYTIESGYMYGDDFIEAYSDFDNVVFVKTFEDLMSYMQSKINVFIDEHLEENNE